MGCNFEGQKSPAEGDKFMEDAPGKLRWVLLLSCLQDGFKVPCALPQPKISAQRGSTNIYGGPPVQAIRSVLGNPTR